MNKSLPSIRSAGITLSLVVMSLSAIIGFAVTAQATGLVASAGQAGSGVVLNPQHPDRYVVKRGDTLWDISAMFLRDPWYWPEIWQVNPQVLNPHLIYPGDVLVLVYIDGQPRVIREGTQAGGTERLSPRIRESDLEEAITTIPLDVVGPFLSRGTVLERNEIDRLPYIAAIRENHLVGAAGNDVYVRGKIAGMNQGYTVVHVGEPLIDPDDNEVVGYEGIYVGEGTIRREGDPATLFLTKSQREALRGDRLINQDYNVPLQFYPRAPDNEIDGRIIHVVAGTTIIGQYQVVILNRGARDGLDVGHVLSVWQAGPEVRDRFAKKWKGGEKITLPDERAGTLMVFRTYDRISYGLIMEATSEMHLQDKVRNPG